MTSSSENQLNVKHLTLQGHSRRTCFTAFHRFLPKHSSITDLALQDYTFTNISSFRRMLCTFPRLSQLKISSVKISQLDHFQRTGASCRCYRLDVVPQLKSLSIIKVESATLELIVRWLLVSDALSEACELQVEQALIAHAQPIIRLLKAMAQSLQCLQLIDHQYGQSIFRSSIRWGISL